ncbi:murein L,D-transpeptidase catalytic domain family protein [uncultured Cyclobacterium sp.]|uniref:murein L,D-transpeptidase catalytic domain family protein n=1 Tax=uncultured Cyclobacterium sp. TaxID=453820 RepID=UPI0030EBE7D9|tara:strand:- start:75118 stop:75846 length:729 start_codon:yes stop_codon:yes gene_type:complete
MIKIIFFTLLIVCPVFSFENTQLPELVKKVEPNSKSGKIASSVATIWERIRSDQNSLKKEVLLMAVEGYQKMLDNGLLEEGKPLTIIDYDLPSSEERLWIIDIQNQDLEYVSLVAHGRNSGGLHAKKFSNVPESYMSSLGFYLTGETYIGKHGQSLRLDGMEEGINDNARLRAIVIHAADYAESSFVKLHGRLGRSLGCPALPDENFKEIINLIKDKSCLFIHSSENNYSSQSAYIERLTAS